MLESDIEVEEIWRLDRGMGHYNSVPVAHKKMIMIIFFFCSNLRQNLSIKGTFDVFPQKKKKKQALQGGQEHLDKGSTSAALHLPQVLVFSCRNGRGALWRAFLLKTHSYVPHYSVLTLMWQGLGKQEGKGNGQQGPRAVLDSSPSL